MASLGRLLGTLGWLWFIAGLAAPIFDVGDISFIPGLILVVVGRLLRSQARRRQPEEEAETATAQTAPRPLNTDRTTPMQTPSPPPRPVESKPPTPVLDRTTDMEQEEESEKLFSKALFAASAHTGETSDEDVVTEDEVESKTLTSDEMIARARRRWDRRG